MSITATLRECHRLRKHLKALQEEIDRGPRVLKAQQNRLTQEQQAHKDHYDAITKLKLKQRDDEGSLKQAETRLTKLEAQLLGISVPKEYEAKKSEIRQAQEKKTGFEDAILAAMGELEEKNAAIPAVEKQWADAKAAFAQYEIDAKERLERLKADQVESRETLANLETTIPAANRAMYDHLTKGMGPDAYAAMKDRICQGCRTGMTQQREMELRAGAFLLCSTCGKMLYPLE